MKKPGGDHGEGVMLDVIFIMRESFVGAHCLKKKTWMETEVTGLADCKT